MALTVPDTAALAAWMGLEEADLVDDHAQYLQQAVDLLWTATEADEDPDADVAGGAALRVVTYGKLAMAEWLIAYAPHRTRSANPMREEEIGSYRYVIQRAAEGSTDGVVMWFDKAVGVLDSGDLPEGLGAEGMDWSDPAIVLVQDSEGYQRQAGPMQLGPSERYAYVYPG